MAKSGQSLKGLLKMSKRDRQVSPSQENDYGEIRLEDTIKNIEEKRIEREQKRIKKEEAQRVKDIAAQGRIEKRSIRKAVKQDLARTSCETFVTFCFIVTVGTFLFGGGTALIVSGRENNIVDFIVVGSSGIVIGIIFTTAGIALIFKPIYENYQKRKKDLQRSAKTQPPGALDMPLYFDDVQRTTLTNQLRDEGRRSRRPSNVELYGDTPSIHPAAGMHEVSPKYPRHKQEPPHLAVPNVVEKISKNKSQQEPVFFLNTKEDLQAVSAEEIVGYRGSPDNSSHNRQNTVQSLVSSDLDSQLQSFTGQGIADLTADSHKTEDVELQNSVLDHGRSDSPVVVVTNPSDTMARKDYSSEQTCHDEQEEQMSKSTIIVNELLSREHSVSTVRSKIQTPSSVMLTYDKDTFEEGTGV